MIKKILFSLLLSLILFSKLSLADEGMWLPNLIKAYNYSDMQSKGLMISAEDLYSANKASIKDAIVHFNGGCTAEIISEKGLIVTNHHCGYSFIADHSTPEKDYLKNGFWAKNYDEEMPNYNLYVDFIIKIEDVTAKIIPSGNETQEDIKTNINNTSQLLIKGSPYLVSIKPFNYGTKYFAFIIERFKDIRLVGTPPSSIGKFGYDTDNWVWPRHTGDFSLFRIYADKNNNPANFSALNKPYKPKYSLPISLEGIKENDFAMVYGFPGSTDQYLTSYAVKEKLEVENPIRISMRKTALEVINKTMDESEEKRIKLASFQSRVSNYWKKFQGESFGLKQEHAISKKELFEKEFTRRINQKESLKNKYGHILPQLKELYGNKNQFKKNYYAIVEIFYSAVGHLRPNIFSSFSDYYYEEKNKDKFIENSQSQLNFTSSGYYNYTKAIYLNAIKELIKTTNNQSFKTLSNDNIDLEKIDDWFDKNFKNFFLYNEKIQAKLLKAKYKKQKKILAKDKIFQLGIEIHELFQESVKEMIDFKNKEEKLMKEYVQAIEEVFPDKTLWYDANSTLRISYGNVIGSSPRDGMTYNYFTTTDGILEKYIPGDKEFDVPEKLINLIKAKDFGRYAQDSSMIVCFTSDNHTTGGNSGSPVLNGKGHLIGINFDRSWESTMSDIMYSERICRNITLDVRYMLFIIDKYAGAEYLIKEMKLIEKEDPLALKRKVLNREIEILTSILTTSPKQADLYFKRGKAYYELGELRKSLADYEKAVQLDPKKEYIKQKDFINSIIKQIESIKE